MEIESSSGFPSSSVPVKVISVGVVLTVKLAVMLFAAFMVTEQGLVVPVQAPVPLQPEKV